MIHSDKVLCIITDIIERGASDIHIYSDATPCYRLHGELISADDYDIIRREEVLNFINDITDSYHKSIFYSGDLKDVDFSTEIPGASRVRVNIYREYAGEAVVLRVIPGKIPTMEDLKLPLVVEDLAKMKSGLLLVTGRARHGKSTTIASIIEFINNNYNYNIVTIERPIEFVFTPKRCRIHQREVGYHVSDFAHAIESTLNEDPDVIYVSDIKDMETANMVLRIAETGPLVLSTLHTRTAIESIERYVNFFPEENRLTIRHLLGDTLRGIVSQTLIQRKDFKGMIVAYEILINTIAIANMIRDDKSQLIYSAMQTGGKERMCTLDDTLKRLMQEGRINTEDAYKMCTDKRRFEYVLKNI